MPSGPSDKPLCKTTLQRLDYRGAYDSVQRFARDYKQLPANVAAFVPLTFAAGEAYQFDWSEEEVKSSGTGAGQTHLAIALGLNTVRRANE